MVGGFGLAVKARKRREYVTCGSILRRFGTPFSSSKSWFYRGPLRPRPLTHTHTEVNIKMAVVAAHLNAESLSEYSVGYLIRLPHFLINHLV